MDVQRLAREERADFAAFLAILTPQQWQAPTLCAQWRVRDVVAHVISYDGLGARGLLALAAQGRLRLSRINAAAPARYSTRSPEQLLALLTDHPQPRGVPAALGGRVGLVETLMPAPSPPASTRPVEPLRRESFSRYLSRKFTDVMDNEMRDPVRNAIAHLSPYDEVRSADRWADPSQCDDALPVLKYMAHEMIGNELAAATGERDSQRTSN